MTTNNHPAHGPVSLERLHQIREILSKAAAQSDGGNIGYAMADAVKVIDGAIAAFGAEPAAWRWFHLNQWHVTNDEERARDLSWDSVKVTPLYTTPPAPEVPPAIEPDYEVIKAILPTANPDEYACCIAADMWNACRAAMLQAGNSPVIPNGYVLVPIVPTEDMIINGFESVPDPHFSDEKEWEEYEALSGCRQAARRAELCWAAMIKAAPKQENI